MKLSTARANAHRANRILPRATAEFNEGYYDFPDAPARDTFDYMRGYNERKSEEE